MDETKTYSDLYIRCSAPVPEDRMVCLSCELNPKPVTPLRQTKPIKKLKIPCFLKEHRNEP